LKARSRVRQPIEVPDLAGIAHVATTRSLRKFMAKIAHSNIGAVLFDQPIYPILTGATALGVCGPDGNDLGS
jgi:hypothetical protein